MDPASHKTSHGLSCCVIVHSYSNALFKILGKNYYRHRRIHKKLLMFLGKRNGTE